ncbi:MULTISPECIES: glycosyltransferase family 2 protein [unclassified Streptomyces]|uniref:glycosyltransferase family 2 protein n=1 Tax=unclassified Streptomyces TaxID=2593676 RepID=UPI00093D1479|nr:glycosyltransferase [Streptomyces sp. CB02058]OKI95720.1 glycosyl transferase [Streptomyces sp. CB02058]
MKVSLVIPTYNSKELLAPCLVSLNHQIVAEPDAFEVVLVDDGSTDGTGEMVDALSLTYPLRRLYLPRTEHSCRSAARNAGIRAADGEVIAFADGDQIIDPLFLQEHIRCHRDRDDVVAIGFRDYLAPGPVDLGLLAKEFATEAFPAVAEADERAEVTRTLSENLAGLATGWHFLYGCNVSVRKERLLAVGSFDENIKRWSFEDVELGYRLHRAGLTLVHTPYARVYHQAHPESDRERYADWRENFAYFVDRHPGTEVRLQWILDDYFDPDRENRLSWFDAYLRFEFACRALEGRLPLGRRYEVLVVDGAGLPGAGAEVARLGALTDLVVIDTTDDRDLPLTVQGLRTGRELLYFKRPDPEVLRKAADAFGFTLAESPAAYEEAAA